MQKSTQSQKTMIFILSMTMYGMACLVSELLGFSSFQSNTSFSYR